MGTPSTANTPAHTAQANSDTTSPKKANATAIGLGVGLGIGLSLIILCAAWLGFRIWRRNKRPQAYSYAQSVSAVPPPPPVELYSPPPELDVSNQGSQMME